MTQCPGWDQHAVIKIKQLASSKASVGKLQGDLLQSGVGCICWKAQVGFAAVEFSMHERAQQHAKKVWLRWQNPVCVQIEIDLKLSAVFLLYRK